MAITYRTAGAWGSGKGSDLDAVEIDTNFYELDQRVTAVETTPPEAVSIDHFVVDGVLLTIYLTNGDTHGPFVLPVAQWRWTGNWLPEVQYFVGDIVVNNGNVYFVRVQHVSVDTFDPDLFTVDGQVYILLLSKIAQPYDIAMFYNDTTPSGDEIIMLNVIARPFEVPADFAGSYAFLKVATSATPITFPIYKNELVIGTVQFSPGVNTTTGGGQFGIFAMDDSQVDFVAGDRLSISLPYEDDPTAAGLAITIVGTTPAL